MTQATSTLEPQVASEVEMTPDELEAVLAAYRAKKAAEAAKAEALANALPGYPKTLYNPQFKFESIAVPRKDAKGKPILDKNGLPVYSDNALRFFNGAIVVEDPETEDFIRAACSNRIYERSTDEPVTCATCQWQAYSHAAVLACERSH